MPEREAEIFAGDQNSTKRKLLGEDGHKPAVLYLVIFYFVFI